MDARESSGGAGAGVAPTTLPASGREGQVEDDVEVLTVTCRLAKDAALLFQGGRYAECVEVLNQILQKKEDEDPKVLHNIAVAEYLRDGYSDPRKLLDVLKKIKKNNEDLKHASVEEMGAAGSLGSNATIGSSALQYQTPSADSTPAYANELDTSIVTLNTAVILFHLHEYAHALTLLEPLYRKLHPLEETIALHVCLLLVDIALACNDVSRAADVIEYMEKSFGIGHMTNQGETGNTVENQPPNHISKVTALVVPDNASTDSSASENTLDRTLSEDALEYENLLTTLDTSGQNVTQSNSNDLSRISSDRTSSGIDLKLKIHLYKVRLLLLMRNLKAAKREVKLGMNVARGRDSSIALHLKSQLEYARGNHRKAIKLLMTSSNKTEPGVVSMYNNNLGCIYHQLQKHNASIALFSKALRGSSSLRKENPSKLLTFSQDKSFSIMYNCGLQYLACGKPLIASRCFYKASTVFYNRPSVWLRLAECCLLALEKGLLSPGRQLCSSGSEPVKLHVAGLGKWRQLIVNVNPRNGLSDSTIESGSPITNDGFTLSIPSARQCLLNALHLLHKCEPRSSANLAYVSEEFEANIKSSNQKIPQVDDSKASNSISVCVSAGTDVESKENRGSGGSHVTFLNSISAYEASCRRENHMMRQAILADLAYVELCLDSPLRALSFARSLRQLPDCSRVYTFFSVVYAAEALCLLNQPKEAAETLSLYLSEGNNVQLPYLEDDGQKGRSERVADPEESNGSLYAKITSSSGSSCSEYPRPEEARVALFVNLAAVCAMQGDLEQARLLLKKALSAVPNDPQALLAAVYLDLRLGNASDAVAKLKLCSRVRFFPNGIPVSSTR